MKETFKKYFAKDGALRHYTQHFLIALCIFLIFRFFVFERAYVGDIILFFAFSYLIDLDSVFTVLLSKRNLDFRKDIIKLIKDWKFEEAMIYATKNHKKINNLRLHNLLFYFIFSCVLIVCILLNSITLGYIF